MTYRLLTCQTSNVYVITYMHVTAIRIYTRIAVTAMHVYILYVYIHVYIRIVVTQIYIYMYTYIYTSCCNTDIVDLSDFLGASALESKSVIPEVQPKKCQKRPIYTQKGDTYTYEKRPTKEMYKRDLLPNPSFPGFVRPTTRKCHKYERVVSHVWIGHITNCDQSCHTYERVMSH